MQFKLKNVSLGKLVGKDHHTDGFYALAEVLGFRQDGSPNVGAAIKTYENLIFIRNKVSDDYVHEFTSRLLFEWGRAQTMTPRALPEVCALNIRARKYIFAFVAYYITLTFLPLCFQSNPWRG